MPAQPPLLIAHRGESYDAPENTLASINLAWARGAWAVEIDVRRSAEGRIVVFHDADTKRLCGVRGAVIGQTVAELRKLDAGAWKGERWAGERIPLLAEVLKTVPPHGRLFIEVKDMVECVPALQRVIRKASLDPRQALVMSFDARVMAAAAEQLSEYERALILDSRTWTAPGGVERGCAKALRIGCQSLDIGVHRRLNARVINTVHGAGLKLYCWTVNRVSTARRLAAAGIDGITTDRCAWMRERL